MLGWTDFDPAAVQALKRGSMDAVDKTRGGGLRCPLKGHDHWLRWLDGNYRRGTEPHEDLGVSFRVSGTFVHADPLDNFVAGRELIAAGIAGEWNKAETWRLGNEQSEDALSWNVFRLLQEAGELRAVASVLAGIDLHGEPRLILWGRLIEINATSRVPAIGRVLDELESDLSQQTEPDVVLHAPGEAWVFIQAKFTSRTDTYAKTPDRVPGWVERYGGAPGVFHEESLTDADARTFPQQLLRNVAVAHAIAGVSERSAVVSLTRRGPERGIEASVRSYLDTRWQDRFRAASWEDLYEAFSERPRFEQLADYMERKSAGLEAAFQMGRDRATPNAD